MNSRHYEQRGRGMNLCTENIIGEDIDVFNEDSILLVISKWNRKTGSPTLSRDDKD